MIEDKNGACKKCIHFYNDEWANWPWRCSYAELYIGMMPVKSEVGQTQEDFENELSHLIDDGFELECDEEKDVFAALEGDEEALNRIKASEGVSIKYDPEYLNQFRDYEEKLK